MGIFAVIAAALGAVFSEVEAVWKSWHFGGGVSPEALATDAKNIADGVSTVLQDGEAAYQEVKNQLLAKHPTLDVNHARVFAAVAGASVAQKATP